MSKYSIGLQLTCNAPYKRYIYFGRLEQSLIDILKIFVYQIELGHFQPS